MITAPSKPTKAPSKTNGQRMNASDAPTRRMISISSAAGHDGQADRVDDDEQHDDPDDDQHDRARGPQDVGDGQHAFDEVLRC